MTVDSPTRRQPYPPPPEPPRRSGISPLTLAVAAISAVVAAVVVSKVWSSGTLWATAMTPVVVSLVKEALERPAQRIGEASMITRRRRPDEIVVERVDPGPAPGAPPRPEGYRLYGIQRKHWKLAIVTGVLAFAIGAAVLTLPELVAGRSITRGSQETTLFHGKSRAEKKQEQRTQTETTPTTPQGQGTTTTPPAQTTTTPQNTTTTPPPTTTAPPSGGQPVPSQTNPSPPPPGAQPPAP